MNFVDHAVRDFNKKPDDFPPIKTGSTVAVHVRVKEGEKERVQVYKGTIIKIQGSGVHRAFTVRKMSSGIGVERSFPLNTPSIAKIELLAHARVRRSRLYFLRNLKGRAARLETENIKTEKKAKNKKK